MRLSKRFLTVIAENVIATPRRLEALSKLDPQRIYVENVRAVLGTNSWIARTICETAVRQGIFRKRVQILCPDGSVAKTVPDRRSIPPTVRCWREVDGEVEPFVEESARLDTLEFYEYARGSV